MPISPVLESSVARLIEWILSDLRFRAILAKEAYSVSRISVSM